MFHAHLAHFLQINSCFPFSLQFSYALGNFFFNFLFKFSVFGIFHIHLQK